MSTTQSWMSAYQSRVRALPGAGAPWLAAVRQRAIERFVDEGWPTLKQEGWRTTSLAELEQQNFTTPGAALSPAALIEQLRGNEPGHWLVFVDGRYAPELSAVGKLPDGSQVCALSSVLNGHPEQVEPYFGVEQDGSTPSALNLAMAADGGFVSIGAGRDIDLPINLVFVAVTAQSACFPRNLIIAQAGSHATVVEHYIGSDGGATLTNAVTRAFISADANITHLKLQQESDKAFHMAAIDVMQERGSVYNSHSLSFGAHFARNDIETQFRGDGCETLFNGLYYVDGRRHVDHHTLIDHAKPSGSSREFYRGILAGGARGVFRGRIRVAQGADRTDALQRTDSLLLSRLAKADARPELEIYAEDVKCAHGATIGQLDDASLFYLRTRGIEEDRARSLLTYAFAAEVLGRIEIEPLRKRAAWAIRALLPGGESLEELA
ncbi:MAG TPA: Fe-S cluster assembly protein SufD [Paralcaligenes sp.]